MYDLIIKNGYVVSPSSTVKCDIAVSGKKIAGLGTYSGSEGKRVIDAEGKYILPGVIEAHMHCQAPFQGCLGQQLLRAERQRSTRRSNNVYGFCQYGKRGFPIYTSAGKSRGDGRIGN